MDILTLQGDKIAFKTITTMRTLEAIFDFRDLFHPLILKLEGEQGQEEGVVPIYSFREDERRLRAHQSHVIRLHSRFHKIISNIYSDTCL